MSLTLRACTDTWILSATNITRIHITSGIISIQLRQCELRAALCMPEFVTFVKSDVSCFIDKGQRTILLEKINRIVSQDRSVLFSEAPLFRAVSHQ